MENASIYTPNGPPPPPEPVKNLGFRTKMDHDVRVKLAKVLEQNKQRQEANFFSPARTKFVVQKGCRGGAGLGYPRQGFCLDETLNFWVGPERVSDRGTRTFERPIFTILGRRKKQLGIEQQMCLGTRLWTTFGGTFGPNLEALFETHFGFTFDPQARGKTDL